MNADKIREYQFSIALNKTGPVLRELAQQDTPLKKDFLLLLSRFHRLSQE